MANGAGGGVSTARKPDPGRAVARPRPTVRRLIRLALMAAALAIGLPLLGMVAVSAWAASRTYTADAVPPRRVAIVFGAGIYRGGGLSPMLEDRVETAIGL